MTAWWVWFLVAAGLFLLVWGLNLALEWLFPPTRITPNRREFSELDEYYRAREALSRNDSRRWYTNGGNPE